MWALIPAWLKICAAAVAAAALLSAVSFQIGKREGKSVAQIEAAKAALDRINTLEKNNASFRNMSDRHRCLVFMRDSGLPDSACD
jgi:putative SOS response-associated peptidase YedK